MSARGCSPMSGKVLGPAAQAGGPCGEGVVTRSGGGAVTLVARVADRGGEDPASPEGLPRFGSRLWRQLLSIPAEEIRFEVRGFRGGQAGMKERIELIGARFRDGYHCGLETATPVGLAHRLGRIHLEEQGFAYEGAAMAWAIREFFTPWDRHRIRRLLAGPGEPHAYMVHVGVGWALARLPGHLGRRLERYDPLLRWLVADGYGFHEGFFKTQAYRAGADAPARVEGYGRRAFDQGLGRALWFMEGGDGGLVSETIQRFGSERHRDLWSGVGLACAYAGVIEDVSQIEALGRAAGAHGAALAQGAAFAAKARSRAGNQARHTEVVCRVLCGLAAEEAAAVTDEALVGLCDEGEEPAYEVWRRRVQTQFDNVRVR